MATNSITPTLHAKRFPSESDDYRQARDDLLRAETELRALEGAVTTARAGLALGGEVPTDYAFEEWDTKAHAARSVQLSQLFQDGQDALFVYSFMFIPGEHNLPLEDGSHDCTHIIDEV